MMQNFIRKFRPNLKHIAAVVFLAAGIIFLIIGAVKYIKVSNANPIEDRYTELKKGSCVSFTLENVVYAQPKTNQNKIPLCWLQKDSRSADPTKNALSYCILAAGKYRFLTADISAAPDVYSILENGEFIGADNNERYIGYVTDNDSELFAEYVGRKSLNNTYNERFFLGGSETEITDFTADNCSRYGIRIVDVKKERRKWLWSVPFFAVGIVLLIFAGSPFFYMPENIPEL